AAKRLDAPAVRAEIVAADARARADVNDAAVEVELDVVDVAHQPRAELGIEVIRLVPDDLDARQPLQRTAHVRHRRAERLDVVCRIGGIRLRGHAVRRGLARGESALAHAEVVGSRREHIRSCYTSEYPSSVKR